MSTKSFSLSKLDMELTLVIEFCTDRSVSSSVPYLSESVCDAVDDLRDLAMCIIGDLNSLKYYYFNTLCFILWFYTSMENKINTLNFICNI